MVAFLRLAPHEHILDSAYCMGSLKSCTRAQTFVAASFCGEELASGSAVSTLEVSRVLPKTLQISSSP